MSLFSKLFGGGSGGTPKAPEAVEHDGFKIFVEPIKEGSGYRLAAQTCSTRWTRPTSSRSPRRSR